MKLFQKPADERVAQEINHIYKVGYYVMTYGILLDILLQAMDTIQNGGHGFRWIEFWVFMAAQFTCMALQLRKGLMDDNAYAECETFPTGHYAFVSLAVGALAGAVITVLRLHGFPPVNGSTSVLFGLGIGYFLSVCVPTAIAVFVLYRIMFFFARRRRIRQAQKLDSEEEE